MSEVVKKRIIELAQDGYSLRQIEEETKVPRSTISRWVKKQKKDTEDEEQKEYAENEDGTLTSDNERLYLFLIIGGTFLLFILLFVFLKWDRNSL